MFDQIDFKNCKIIYMEADGCLEENLLQIQCPNGRLIAVGWSGDQEVFCTKVIENCNWEKPCYQLHKSKKEWMEHDVQPLTLLLNNHKIDLTGVQSNLLWGFSDENYKKCY